jgi:hypothetical protein
MISRRLATGFLHISPLTDSQRRFAAQLALFVAKLFKAFLTFVYHLSRGSRF